MDKKNRQRVIYAMSAALVMMLLQNWSPGRLVNVFSDSEFDQLLKNRQIEEVSVRQDVIEGKLRKSTLSEEELLVPTQADPQLADRPGQSEVQFTGVFESTWLPDLLSWVLPALFFFALWWFFVRRFAEKQG